MAFCIVSGKYAFVKSSSVKQFIHSLLSNSALANVMAPVINQVINIMAYKGCTIVRQIAINYDLIEVKPFGTCFSFKKKSFVMDAIAVGDIGKSSI